MALTSSAGFNFIYPSNSSQNQTTMAMEETSIKVFQALLSVPEGQRLLKNDQPILANAFLEIPVVAKELFSHEPGCAVRYEAIEEKIKVLEPFLKVTPSGPKLMAFFDELLKQRDGWAVALANYESHVVMTFVLQQNSSAGSAITVDRRALNGQASEAALKETVDAAEKKLSATKNNRQFCQYVRILEECAKKHKKYLCRRAHAEKTRDKSGASKRMKRKSQQRPGTGAAARTNLTSTLPLQTVHFDIYPSVFNPDWPEFSQFVNCYSSPDAGRAASEPSIGEFSYGPHNHATASEPFDPTNVGLEIPVLDYAIEPRAYTGSIVGHHNPVGIIDHQPPTFLPNLEFTDNTNTSNTPDTLNPSESALCEAATLSTDHEVINGDSRGIKAGCGFGLEKWLLIDSSASASAFQPESLSKWPDFSNELPFLNLDPCGSLGGFDEALFTNFGGQE